MHGKRSLQKRLYRAKSLYAHRPLQLLVRIVYRGMHEPPGAVAANPRRTLRRGTHP